MTDVSTTQVRTIVQAVLTELGESATPVPSTPIAPESAVSAPQGVPTSPEAPRADAADITGTAVGAGRTGIDVADPTTPEERRRRGVTDPINESGLSNLMSSTTARIGSGRAGPRPRTGALLLFQADHAVAQDAIFGDVPSELLGQLGMFAVQTQAGDQEEFLLRPDLGRRLSEQARADIAEKCTKNPQVQIVVGDGLSAAAVANNLAEIYPVIVDGLTAAGVSTGTPFFVRFCRVGVMNDINDVVQADVVVLLIGERPGLGVADAMSVYSGWRPTAGKTDAHRDVICMITRSGGTNPLEAGAFVVEHVRNVIAAQASGVELRLQQGGSR